MVRSRLGSILALAAGILITTGGCAESPSAPVQAGASLELLRLPQGPSFSRSGSETRSQVIGPEGGVIEISAGRLVFPAGAVSEPTEIGMRADGAYQGVRLSPHGLQFPANAKPVLELRATGPSVDRLALQVVYVNEANQILEVLPNNGQGSRVITHLEHFSGYLIASGRSEDAAAP
ncbi:MAG TPA: hypothetical protein VK358_01140 [Longimicrobium sp.]|nr:hypothetical protein [Longimicrobium sp.]